MTAPLIQDDAALRALCARLAGAEWIALDTEFMRVRTYSARLCLIQVATPEVIACIDPLAVNIDPLLDLLYEPRALKVLHAARQDLEVFFDIRQAVPAPVFDTQIAAALTGYDDQIGYSALVEKITGQLLPKVNQRADWAARPLTPELVAYAADDVRYLCKVYRHLEQKLAALGRREWLGGRGGEKEGGKVLRKRPRPRRAAPKTRETAHAGAAAGAGATGRVARARGATEKSSTRLGRARPGARGHRACATRKPRAAGGDSGHGAGARAPLRRRDSRRRGSGQTT